MDFLDSFSLLVGLIFMFGTASLFNLSFPVRGIVGNWLAIWCLSLAQVVLLSEILSELHLIGRTGFLVGHLLLFLADRTNRFLGGTPVTVFSSSYRVVEKGSADNQRKLLVFKKRDHSRSPTASSIRNIGINLGCVSDG
jgi:hypothetical protein